jgi:hypothetical protein
VKLQCLTIAALAACSHGSTPTCGSGAQRFEPNVGQFASDVRYVARAGAATMVLTDDRAELATADGRVVSWTVHGQRAGAALHAGARLGTHASYFIGDPQTWRTNVPTFASVTYDGVLPGVDLVYHGSDDGKLEYDFVVAPHASPGALSLDVSGADDVRIADDGSLAIRVGDQVLRQRPPAVYQDIDGRRVAVRGSYRLVGAQQVGVEVAAYDARRALIIDPVIDFATFVAPGENELTHPIAVDAQGNIYVAGTSHTMLHGIEPDAFIAKMDPSGSHLLWTTYLGGSGPDAAYTIAVDGAGNAYVAGTTSSADFPVTPGAFERLNQQGLQMAFVAKLDASGAVGYATYLHGANALGIAVDTTGNAYVTGCATTSAFVVTPGAFQTTYLGDGYGADAFALKLNPAGSSLVYSTLLAGTANDCGESIAVDSAGAAYVTGQTMSHDFPVGATPQRPWAGSTDSFVAKVAPSGSSLAYVTLLGGSNLDLPLRIVVDRNGSATIAGATWSTDFPITENAYQISKHAVTAAYVATLDATGAIAYATYLDGNGTTQGFDVAVDDAGNHYVVGHTGATNFPVTADALQSQRHGVDDAFVTEIDATGTQLVYSTYLGGTGQEFGNGIALGPNGSIIVTGYTTSADFPVTPGAFDTTYTPTEQFIVKLGTGSGDDSGSDGSGSDGSGSDGSGSATGSDGSGSATGSDGSGSAGDGSNGSSGAPDAGDTNGEPGAPAGCCAVGGGRGGAGVALLACLVGFALRRGRRVAT